MRSIKDLFINLFRTLMVSNDGLSEDEIEYLKRWEWDKFNLSYQSTSRVIAIILPLSTVAITILSPAPQRYAQIPTHFLMSVLAVYWARCLEQLRLWTPWIALTLNALAAVGYASAINLAFRQTPDVNAAVFLIAAQSAISIITIIQYPFANGSVLLWSAGSLILVFLSVSADPSIHTSTVGQIATFNTLLATWFRYSLIKNIRHQALTEFAVRQTIVKEQRAITGDVELQIREAEELQKSFSFELGESKIPGLKIDIHHKRVERLATAWCAVRHLAHGETVVFLVDATTLGLRAGLMIHSLQALWALSLTATNFDPRTWLSTASRALGAVGADVEKAVSLSLVILTKDKASLYATHLSHLWLVEEQGGHAHTTYLSAELNRFTESKIHVIAQKDFPLRDEQKKSLVLHTKNHGPTNLDAINQSFQLNEEKKLNTLHSEKNQDQYAAINNTTTSQADSLMVWVSYEKAS